MVFQNVKNCKALFILRPCRRTHIDDMTSMEKFQIKLILILPAKSVRVLVQYNANSGTNSSFELVLFCRIGLYKKSFIVKYILAAAARAARRGTICGSSKRDRIASRTISTVSIQSQFALELRAAPLPLLVWIGLWEFSNFYLCELLATVSRCQLWFGHCCTSTLFGGKIKISLI